MNTIRREQMLEFIKSKGQMSVKELIMLFSNVSSMTVHRDLDYLEKKGAIVRVHGGAKYISPDESKKEPAFSDREIANRELKRIIAGKASSLIKSGSSVYIDSGTTAAALCDCIPNTPLSIVTNSPNSAVMLSDKSFVNVMLCGGTLEKKNLALYGSAAIASLEKINIDLAFVVASGYSKDCGFTCGNEGEAAVKSFVCKKARKVALLVDSSKLDTVLPFTFAVEDDIDYFICDKAVSGELIENFKQKGIIIL